jgi:hypothetical protein
MRLRKKEREMNHFTDQEIEEKTLEARHIERRATGDVIAFLEENERRRLYAKKHSSLFEYCLKVLQYSGNEAQARISSMRLVRDVPSLKEDLNSGRLHLTHLTLAKALFNQEERKFDSIEKKEALLDSFKGKSKRACEKIVASHSPDVILVKEKERAVTGELTELKLVLSDELLSKLKRLKDLSGKASYTDLLEMLADQEIKRREKESVCPAKVNPKARVATPKLRREIFQRDKEQCTYQNDEGERCESKRYLQIDHIKPYALGGETKKENLRLLCFAHNQLEARKIFGKKFNK